MPLATGSGSGATLTVSLPRAPGAVAGQGGVATCTVSRIEATCVYTSAPTAAVNVKFLDDSTTIWQADVSVPAAGTWICAPQFAVPKRSQGANPRVVITNNVTGLTSNDLKVEFALEP